MAGRIAVAGDSGELAAADFRMDWQPGLVSVVYAGAGPWAGMLDACLDVPGPDCQRRPLCLGAMQGGTRELYWDWELRAELGFQN